MAEYIEREALLSELREMEHEWRGTWTADGMAKSIDVVEKAPAADVAPAVHGWWIPVEADVIFECSNCECEISTSWDYDEAEMWVYCPHCGAMMDGKEPNQ